MKIVYIVTSILVTPQQIQILKCNRHGEISEYTSNKLYFWALPCTEIFSSIFFVGFFLMLTCTSWIMSFKITFVHFSINAEILFFALQIVLYSFNIRLIEWFGLYQVNHNLSNKLSSMIAIHTRKMWMAYVTVWNWIFRTM